MFDRSGVTLSFTIKKILVHQRLTHYVLTVKTTVHDRMPEECRAWAKNGDCLTHQKFMMQNCRESCATGGYVNGESLSAISHGRMYLKLLHQSRRTSARSKRGAQHRFDYELMHY